MRRPESDESGWISMCDLLLLLFAVGLVIAFISIKAAAMSKRAEEDGTSTIKILTDNLTNAREELGIWTIKANESAALVERIKDLFGSQGITPEGMVSAIDGAKQERDKAQHALDEAQAAVAAAAEAVARAKAEVAGATASAADAKDDAAKANTRADVAEEKQRAAEEKQRVAEKSSKSEIDRADAERKRAEDAVARAKQAEGMLGTQQGENSGLTDEIKKLNDVVAGAAGINKEILGIPGEMGNVVFVVDRSQSMKDGDRWEDARRTVTSWIKHLPVKKSALVLFDSDVKVVPAALDSGRTNEFNTQELLELNEENRAQMSSELEAMSPQGATQTLKGLRRAMQFKDLDAIILFTDGAPDSSGVVADASDPREAIYNLVDQWKKSHPEGRVHTVGIGDYFNRRMGEFLVKVAKHGDGTFIGR